MTISVVTVVFNAVRTIEDTILSVAHQTHADVEHIVVDGGSTDGTLEVIARHRHRLAIAISEPDNGLYDAMNKGIAAASGDVIGTLNADDVYADETVLEQVATVMQDPGHDACYADLVYVDRINTARVKRIWRSRSFQPGLFLHGWMPAHPTFYARRTVYEQYGLFDTAYKFQADFELTMRFLEVHGVRAAYVPRIWVRMRWGGLSNRSVFNIIRGNLDSFRACRRHGFWVTPAFILWKIASRVPQFIRPDRSAHTARLQ